MMLKMAGRIVNRKAVYNIALCLLCIIFAIFALASVVVADISSCASYDGVICSDRDECLYGSVFSSSDSDSCCINGVCMPIGEYVETASQMRAQPSMTVTPSGELASVVIDTGIEEYCTSTLNGSICLGDQHCDGESVEYYLGWHCCLGTCKLLPDEILAQYDYVDPETSPDSMFEEDWDYSDQVMTQEEQQAIEGEPQAQPQENKTTLDYVSDAVDKVSGRISWLHVAGIVLGIILLVTLLLALFRRKAGQDMQESARLIQKEAKGPVDLQQQIDSLVSKGMNYEQVKEHLIGQGNPPMVVAAEIQRNYQSRRVQ